MPLLVQKFGGSSLSTTKHLHFVAKRIIENIEKKFHPVVVVSAMGKDTNYLNSLATEISHQPTPEELDKLLVIGEQKTVTLLSMILNDLGYAACSLLGFELPIISDNNFGNANILHIQRDKILNLLKNNIIPIVAGFQGITVDGKITTLGREGSDTTAVALAAVLQAQECQIYSDIDGIYSADPKIIMQAKLLNSIDSEEMISLAAVGAKVLHHRAVSIAHKFRVPLRILSSFNKDSQGTVINYDSLDDTHDYITGITFCRKQYFLHLLLSSNEYSQFLNSSFDFEIDDFELFNLDIFNNNYSLSILVDKKSIFSELTSYSKEKKLNIQYQKDVYMLSVVGRNIHKNLSLLTTMQSLLDKFSVKLLSANFTNLRASWLCAQITEKHINSIFLMLHEKFNLNN